MPIRTTERFAMALAGLALGCLVAWAARAQDIGWSDAYNGACSRVVSNVDINMRQITTHGIGKVSIAHRGVYSQTLPGTTHYPAENTILAFQLAQCQGFPGVEVDLKTTRDGKLILAHDINMMRFTNDDGNGGFFDPAYGAQIRYESRVTRPASGNMVPAIDAMDWETLSKNLKAVKTYDEKGRRVNDHPVEDPNSLLLEVVLRRAKADPTLDKLIWVLDIQSYEHLTKVVQIVEAQGAWNRVLLKVWMGAVPFRTLYSPELPKTSGISHWVFAINPVNSKLLSDRLMTQFYSLGLGEVADTETSVLMSAIEDYFQHEDNNQFHRFDGYELAISGENTPVDVAIEDLTNSFFYPPYIRDWGVIRLADYVRENCREPSPAGDCRQFPDGEYYGNAQLLNGSHQQTFVRLYSLPPGTSERRRIFAQTRSVETEDIRWPGGWRSVNSPLQRTTLQVATLTNFSQ
jgi:hypothetical protein